MARVFSGIQPTGGGVPHLGNYLGALKGYVALQAAGHDTVYCVVDQHATTVAYDPASLARAGRTTAAALIACGVDPARSILFRQSAVPGHSLLAQVLGHAVTLGPLERMTQFKEKGRVAEGEERDAIGLGLLTYPVLMAADILLYHATLVPVGDDQRQHLQYARQVARSFNARFAKGYFAEPQEVLQANATRVMSLRDPSKKMSKSAAESDQEIVFLTDTVDQAAKKFKRATSETDPLPSEVAGLKGREAAANLVGILAGLTDRTSDEVLTEFGGKGFGALKTALSDAFAERVAPIGTRMRDLLAGSQGEVRSALSVGATRANAIAGHTMNEVYRLAGFSDEIDVEDNVITREEAATILGCTESGVGRLIENGYLCPVLTRPEVTVAAERLRTQRRDALEELTRLTEELGLYD